MQNYLPDIPVDLLHFLSRRERECYRLLKEGLTQEIIAHRLFLETQQGVSKMRKRIIIKINNNLIN